MTEPSRIYIVVMKGGLTPSTYTEEMISAFSTIEQATKCVEIMNQKIDPAFYFIDIYSIPMDLSFEESSETSISNFKQHVDANINTINLYTNPMVY